MTEQRGYIAEDRLLSSEELTLVKWLLEHGKPSAHLYLAEIDRLRVVSRCDCGCPSIDFARIPGAPLDVLSDYQWKGQGGRLFGVFLFAKLGQLAGLEVWSIDGQATPTVLPAPAVLQAAG
jgi:hypothetical protein